VQVIIAFQPGGSVDVMARHLLNAMSALLGQPFVVLNRDGASGSVGFGSSPPRSPTATRSAPARPRRSRWAASHEGHQVRRRLLRVHLPVVRERVHGLGAAESPFRTMDDLIAAARANPESSSTAFRQRARAASVGLQPRVSLSLNVVSVPYAARRRRCRT